MPKKEKLPEWEKQENRKRIFLTIFKKPSTFSELLEETKLALATLSNHLKTLEKEKFIERTLKGRRIVYQTGLDEELIMTELKSLSFDVLLDFLSAYNPIFVEQWRSILRDLMKASMKSTIHMQKLKLEKPLLSRKEIMFKGLDVFEASFSKETRQLVNISGFIERFKKTIEAVVKE